MSVMHADTLELPVVRARRVAPMPATCGRFAAQQELRQLRRQRRILSAISVGVLVLTLAATVGILSVVR